VTGPVPAGAWQAYVDAQGMADQARGIVLARLREAPEVTAEEGAVVAALDRAADAAWLRYHQAQGDAGQPEPEAEIA
jgi:hypothetical protein